jgi:hypothetical protein
MNNLEIELVLNTDFGGFHFDNEMASWLKQNRNWTILSEKEYDYKIKHPITTLVEMTGGYFYSPSRDNIELRSNKDLIECVKFLKNKHKDDVYPESYYGYIHDLSIKKVKINIEIEDYYDGKERINSWVDESDVI